MARRNRYVPAPAPIFTDLKPPPGDGKLYTIRNDAMPAEKRTSIIREIQRRKVEEAEHLRSEAAEELKKSAAESKGDELVVEHSGLEVLDEPIAAHCGTPAAEGAADAAPAKRIRTSAEIAEMHKRIAQLEETKTELLWLRQQIQRMKREQEKAQEQS